MIKSLFAALAISLLCLSTTACTEKGSCEKTVDHIMALIQQELGGGTKVDPATERAGLIEKCKKDDGVTKQQEACVLAAKTLRDLSSCDRAR